MAIGSPLRRRKFGPADASSPSNGPNPAKPYWSPANNVVPPHASLGGSVGGGINMDMYQLNQGLRGMLAQQDTANASRLQAFGDPANQKPNGRSFLMGYPELSTRQQELGQQADAAIIGSPFAQQIPLEQQGFARGQMRRPGVMSQQEPASQLEDTNAYGLRSMRNFAPTMQESNAAGGMTGQLGTIGTSSLIRRPDGSMSLMGPTAAKTYSAMIGDSVPSTTAMRQVMQNSMASNRASEPYKNRLVAMKTRADAEKTQQQAGQYISALRQQGMRPSADDVRRSIGMPVAGAQVAAQSTLRPGASMTVDDAVNGLKKGSKQDGWQMTGVPDIMQATPDQLANAMDGNTYRGMGDSYTGPMTDDIERYIAANPDMDPIQADELRGLARKSKAARRTAAANREKQFSVDQAESMQRSNTFPNF